MKIIARALALLVAVLVALFTVTMTEAGERPPLILAAASLQESMTSAAKAWAAKGHGEPVISFAASSALARQIEAGAPADLFVSADEAWMDYLARRGLIMPSTRADLLTNRLVLIAPKASTIRVRITPGKSLSKALASGPLAMADAAVPAGRYARLALERLGVSKQVAPRIVAAENVRAALALVERGAAPLGIVYATDARASRSVRIVGTFPETAHPPIVYPIARLGASTSREAEGFRRFLLSREGKAIFARYGFITR